MKEIVIKISEEDYNLMKTRVCKSSSDYLILDGTPLPEHHGRLIDEQQIIDRFKPIEKFEHWRIGLDGLFKVLSDAPTIIEGSESE